jgi:hypothetical protein
MGQEAADRWYLLAGFIPDDMADMLLAKPERAADVRRVLSAEPTVEAYPTPPITEPV